METDQKVSIEFEFDSLTEADIFITDLKKFQKWKSKRSSRTEKRTSQHIVNLHKRAREIKAEKNVTYKEALALAGKETKKE